MKVRISEMSWVEFQEALKDNPVVLIPMGTCECQNWHNLMGYDFFVADRLAYEVARRTKSLVVPTLPFGYSEQFMNYPGTITLRPESLMNVVEDILDSLIRVGCDHFLFIDNHMPNHAFTEAAARKIKRKYRITCASLWPTAIARHFAKDLFENPKDVLVHGAEPGTSLMQYLQPENIRMDLAERTDLPGQLNGIKLESATKFHYEGLTIDFYLNMDEVSKGGGFGDPNQGDREKGQIIFECMVDYVSKFVLEYKNVNTRQVSIGFENIT